MSLRNSNDFESYQHSKEDAKLARNFSGLQREHIQNLLCETATRVVNLTVDDSTESFIIKHAELTAQVRVLRALLNK